MKKSYQVNDISPERAGVSVNQNLGVNWVDESGTNAASRAWGTTFGKGSDSAEGEKNGTNQMNHEVMRGR